MLPPIDSKKIFDMNYMLPPKHSKNPAKELKTFGKIYQFLKVIVNLFNYFYFFVNFFSLHNLFIHIIIIFIK